LLIYVIGDLSLRKSTSVSVLPTNSAIKRFQCSGTDFANVIRLLPHNLVTEKVIIPISRSEVAKNLPNIINDSFKIYDPSKGNVDFNNIGKADIIYYNGVTLEEGVKSNEDINSTAVSIAAKYGNTYDKAKAIYKWVGSKITYDNNKAVEVMNNSRDILVDIKNVKK